MANKQLKITIDHYEAEDMNLIVVISSNLSSELKTITLYDFIPEDYNVKESPTGWELPELIEIIDEDFTVLDYLDTYSSKELNDLIIETIWNEL